MEDFLRPKSDYSCWYDSAPEQKGGTGLLVLGRRIGLLGVDRLNSEENVDQNLVTLLYVAMTRARYRLTVPYTVENDLIRRVISCLAAEGQKETEVD